MRKRVNLDDVVVYSKKKRHSTGNQEAVVKHLQEPKAVVKHLAELKAVVKKLKAEGSGEAALRTKMDWTGHMTPLMTYQS